VPSQMAAIEALLKEVPVPLRRRSMKTIANTKSRLKAALLHLADGPRLPPRGAALSPEWLALSDRLSDLRLRNGLSRLIRIASYRGVQPADMNDVFLQDVLRGLSQVNWGRDTMRFWRQTVALWNEAATTIDDWPQVTLTAPAESERTRHLPLAAFPVTFQSDVENYLRAAAGGDRFAVSAPPTPLKPSTVRQRREQLRLAASTLAKCLGDPAHVTNLLVLVRPENAKLILTAYLEKAPGKRPTAFTRGLATALLTIARHWAKNLPASQLDELARVKQVLGSEPTGLTAKNLHVVRQFSDRELLARLLSLPDVLAAQARSGRLSLGRRLQKMQIALAIELLLVAPMRLQNLGMLRLDQQLQWPSGRGGPVYITLRDDETKNELPLEYPITGRSRDLLHNYLDYLRRHVSEQDIPWLFVRIDGTRVPDSALRDGITKAVRRELGVRLTPHQYRHLAAMIALDARPGAIGLVKDLLGHRNIKTTINFYAGMRTREAAREYDKILADARTVSAAGS